MPSNRQKRQYSEAQLRGMRLTAKILKSARLQQPRSSFREFAAFVSEKSGVKFNHSRVQAFETAGTITDKRTNVINTVHPDYLKTVQPLSPYPLRLIKEIYDGELIDLIQGGEMLGKMLEEKEDELGSASFKRECKRLELTEEELIEAKRGNLLGGKVAIALSSLLKVPTDEIYLAALAQLNQELD